MCNSVLAWSGNATAVTNPTTFDAMLIAPFNCIFQVGSSLEFALFVLSFMFAEQQLARPCLLVRGAQARHGKPRDSLQNELGEEKACQSLQISNEIMN